MILGAKRLGYVDSTTVENRGETTRGGGGGGGGNDWGKRLGAKRLVTKGK